MLRKYIALFRRTPFFLPLRQLAIGLYKLPWFLKSLKSFKKLIPENGSSERHKIETAELYPCLGDDTSNTGFDPHYLYHISWASRCVREISPAKHVDISSHVHFVSTLSAFIPVDFYDYRPAQIKLSDLTPGAADLLALPFENDSIESLSCMHVIEHIGLGRYGDPLDPDGDIKAINELKRVLAPGGNLLFVVPVGRARLMFNGHRIYSYEQIAQYFDGFDLKSCSIVPDDWSNGISENPTPEFVNSQEYGCGLFWWQKKVK